MNRDSRSNNERNQSAPSGDRISERKAQQLLNRIRALSFATLEVALYLDTHPNHRNALAYYNRLKNELDAVTGEYEMTYGPLSQSSPMTNEENGWLWVKQPWPWELSYPGEGAPNGAMQNRMSQDTENEG
ncbi:MAG: spore coat protein CotJB [Clostridia bacterium]|nr:spore coat protein CotJB [Clostridia bacterium]